MRSLTDSHQETHSVAGEALHQAENGAIEDVRNHTAITKFFLLFPRSLHLGWKTDKEAPSCSNSFPVSCLSRVMQPHKNIGQVLPCMFRRHLRASETVEPIVNWHKNTAASHGTRKGEVANWTNTNVPALSRQKLSYWKSCFHPLTTCLEAWPCHRQSLLFWGLATFCSKLYTLLPLPRDLPVYFVLILFSPSDIYHAFPRSLALERTLHSRNWPNTQFCLITNPLPHAHVHGDRVLFIQPEHLWLCWPQPRGWNTVEERMPLLNSCRDSGMSTCHCVWRLCNAEGFQFAAFLGWRHQFDNRSQALLWSLTMLPALDWHLQP